jgi:lysophospholipid acyltransferase 7
MCVFRVAVTMTVSAFWHGVHPGYYLSFLTIPPNLVAEELMAVSFRGGGVAGDRAGSRRAVLFDWACWFCKMRSFDYMCMGFLLLDLTSTLRYWYSIYFIGHICIAAFIGLGLVCRPQRSRTHAETKSE